MGEPNRAEAHENASGGDGDRCGEPATMRLFWPGRPPIAMCLTHHAQAVALANHMGWYVHSDTSVEPGATCRAVGKVESAARGEVERG